MPFYAIPFEEVKQRGAQINPYIPCTGYPTPGWINAKTGEVLLADAYDGMAPIISDKEKFVKWLETIAKIKI